MVVSSMETLSTQSNSTPIGQGVEDRAGALADDRLQVHQVGAGLTIGTDGLALRVVLGRVHGDEHRQGEVVFRVEGRMMIGSEEKA